jgi:phosphate transport system substrate-binding protein
MLFRFPNYECREANTKAVRARAGHAEEEWFVLNDVTPQGSPSQGFRASRARRSIRLWQLAGVVVAGGVLVAACGSSTPSATKKTKSTTTTSVSGSTTTSVASGATTTTVAGSTATTVAGSTATTAAKTTTATAAVNTAAGSNNELGGANDFLSPSATLNAAGSTFDQPLFARQFYDFNKSDSKVTINYASVGSGTGESDIEANNVAFAASDVPMQASDLAKATGGAVLQIPVVLGGISISYNVPGVGTGLKLTGATIDDIFDGKVTTWNDSEIASSNPGVNLPSAPITVIHRSDSSGTTNAFTNYMNTNNGSWTASGIGVGKSVTWPSGQVGESGNAGVAGGIQNTPDSIGYVELAYSLQSGIDYAQVQNPAGNWITPSATTVASDASDFANVSATNYLIVNGNGANAYPISTYSWALVYQKQTNTNNGIAVGKLLNWMVNAGQSDAGSLGYVPLPANIISLADSTIAQMENSSGQPLFS